MHRLTFVVALLLLYAAPVSAQTVTRQAEWDHQADTLITVSTYAYTLKVDAAVPVSLTASCAQAGANVHCIAPLPAAVNTQLTPGAHTLVLSAINAFGSISSAPLTGSPPTGPISFKLTFTISIP